MKKLFLMIMALALVTGFTQCNKDKVTPTGNDTPVLEGETYQITLTLGGGSDAKLDIVPDDEGGIAPVKFAVDDQIWVAYNGKNCGSLTCTSLSESTDQNGDQLGVFTGSITLTQDGDQPLYFYFLGNKTQNNGLSFVNNDQGRTVGYTVDLSDQTGALPVISYAASEQNFPSEDNNYTVKYNWLMNQCALVKFEMENIYALSDNENDNNAKALYKTDKLVTLYGLDNQVTIDLANNRFTWDQINGGAIQLNNRGNSDAVRYAIIHHGDYSSLTQGALEVPFDPANDPYGFYGTFKIGADIEMNDYYQDAKIDLVWHSGAFSISASGDKAYFSRGNLQYAHRGASTNDGGTWRFAKHQYDYVGGTLKDNFGFQGNVVMDENDNSNAEMSDNTLVGRDGYNGWIDLYGYGTGNNPTNHNVLNTQYFDFHEWGAHDIVNSGKPGNTTWWETLSHAEWKYLVEQRPSATSRAGFATVNGIHGLILLPDGWNWAGGTFTGLGSTLDWNSNVFNVEGWIEMEENGAVFLPAAGYRDDVQATLLGVSETRYDGGHEREQNLGEYWSTDRSATAAYNLGFGYSMSATQHFADADYAMAVDNGHSVRLVHKESASKFFNKK